MTAGLRLEIRMPAEAAGTFAAVVGLPDPHAGLPFAGSRASGEAGR